MLTKKWLFVILHMPDASCAAPRLPNRGALLLDGLHLILQMLSGALYINTRDGGRCWKVGGEFSTFTPYFLPSTSLDTPGVQAKLPTHTTSHPSPGKPCPGQNNGRLKTRRHAPGPRLIPVFVSGHVCEKRERRQRSDFRLERCRGYYLGALGFSDNFPYPLALHNLRLQQFFSQPVHGLGIAR